MEYRGFSGVLYQICEWVMRLAYLHLLWLLFTLAGAVILGAAPATAGMFTVLRQWFLGREVPVFRTYWRAFRESFLGANVLGWLLVATAVILYIDLWVAGAIEGMAGRVLSLFFLSLSVLSAITAVYIFPVFVHYQLSILQYVKTALVIGLSYLPHSLLIGVTIILIGVMYAFLPGLIPLFGLSLMAFPIMKICLFVFSKVEEQKGD